MKTIKINLYTYDELSKEAQERALNDYRNNNDMPFLTNDLNALLMEELQKERIEVINKDKLKLYYSLSYRQGDGLCFEGTFSYKGIYRIYIKQYGNSYHKRSVEFVFEDKDGFEIENEGTEKFKGVYLKICEKLEREGYTIIDNENKEENIRENFTMNEVYFEKEGIIR